MDEKMEVCFSPQVSLKKEDEGVAGLLPGGERVSARSQAAPRHPHAPRPSMLLAAQPVQVALMTSLCRRESKCCDCQTLQR